MLVCIKQLFLFYSPQVVPAAFYSSLGESVDDCGGGYSESIAEMCEELHNGSLPLLILTPNGREEAGTNRDCFILNPSATTNQEMKMYQFLGMLMGIAIRTGSPLSLNLAEPVWKALVGLNLSLSDLNEIDRHYWPSLCHIRDCKDTGNGDLTLSQLDLPFSTNSASGHEVQLSPHHHRVTPENRDLYLKLALQFRLHEFDGQVAAVRHGLGQVIPLPLLSLFTGPELESMVCGSPEIPLALLKSVTTYKGVDPHSGLVRWFWEVMDEYSQVKCATQAHMKDRRVGVINVVFNLISFNRWNDLCFYVLFGGERAYLALWLIFEDEILCFRYTLSESNITRISKYFNRLHKNDLGLGQI